MFKVKFAGRRFAVESNEPTLDFAEKVVVVAGGGGAGRGGMGRAISLRFAGRGASVAVIDRNSEAAKETVEQVRSRGVDGIAIEADLTDVKAVADAVAAVEARFATINTWIHSVGGGGSKRFIVDTSYETWSKAMRLNLDSAFIAAKAVFPVMKRTGGGSFVFFSSIAARRPGSRAGVQLGVSKAAVLSLMRQLAIEGGPYNIRANCIVPGPTRPEVTTAEEEIAGGDSRINMVPLGRFCTSHDHANAAIFLSSDLASFITGEALAVDGGLAWAVADRETYDTWHKG
jgi:NAD(P)-dependent dehydrogenase (short-subunit alcohol dehydrogenase family)